MARKNSSYFVNNPTNLQKEVVNFIRQKGISLIEGQAGTGKDFCSMFYALNELYHNNSSYEKIIVTKPIISVGKELGFLPGTEQEKVGVFEESIHHNIIKLIGSDGLRGLVNSKKIEFVPITFCRGNTFDNSIVIMTESQNANLHELITFVTRVADSSKLILNGDTMQSDIKNSGFATFIELYKNVEGINYMYLDDSYQMRSRLIVEINKIYREYLNKK
jgi:phosphate starvation-inducible protein PhoH